jgi:hypothetical protein
MTTDPVETVHDTVTAVLGRKPVPVTVTIVPGGPTAGLRMSVGAPGTGGALGGAVVVVVDWPGLVVEEVVPAVEVVVLVAGGAAGTEIVCAACKLARQYGVCPGLSITRGGKALNPRESVSLSVTV